VAGILDEFNELVVARDRLADDDPLHAIYGPAEHGAYARARVNDAGLFGLIEQLAGITAYTPLKAMGVYGGRSPASVDEMLSGYGGALMGLLDYVSRGGSLGAEKQ
jgi:hypothetical protein